MTVPAIATVVVVVVSVVFAIIIVVALSIFDIFLKIYHCLLIKKVLITTNCLESILHVTVLHRPVER